MVHSERRQVLRCQTNELLLTGGLPWCLESKSQKVDNLQAFETGRYRIAKWWRLVARLGQIWRSLPFAGCEQQWWSSAAGSGTLRPRNLVMACGHS